MFRMMTNGAIILNPTRQKQPGREYFSGKDYKIFCGGARERAHPAEPIASKSECACFYMDDMQTWQGLATSIHARSGLTRLWPRLWGNAKGVILRL